MTCTIARHSTNPVERTFSLIGKRTRVKLVPTSLEIARGNQLALDNDGLCHHVAHRFKWTGEEHEDLYQIGFMGLRKAALKYDASCGKAFSSYAVPYVTGAIMHFLRDHGTLVKVPRAWREQFAKGKKAQREGLKAHEVLGCTEADWLCIEDAHAHQYHDSLEEQTTGELEADEVRDQGNTPETVWAKIKARIQYLPKTERSIAEMLVKGVSTEDAAVKLGITVAEFTRRLKIVKIKLRAQPKEKAPSVEDGAWLKSIYPRCKSIARDEVPCVRATPPHLCVGRESR